MQAMFKNKANFVVESAFEINLENRRMEPELCKLVAVKYGDVGETLRRYLADNDADFVKFLRNVRDFLVVNVDAKRKTDVNAIVIDTYTIYAKLYGIRNASVRIDAYDAYAASLAGTLPRVVAYSFAAEYRKLQVLFGLAGALADLLVFEMRAFGCHVACYSGSRLPCACRVVRRAIGNALANLTYRQRECKLALCAHTVFLESLTDVIANVPYLAQYYAGLIRNLSWNTDETFAREALASTVPALAHAAVNARDIKCRLAVLSALWNLAPHSAHNRRAMCARRDFLAMLADQLDDLRQQAMLESASGVFKYLCGYVKEDDALHHFLVAELRLVSRLMRLLQAPSFTAVVNALGALSALTAHDGALCDALAHDASAMRVIGHLRATNREHVSAGAKTLQDLIFETPLQRTSHDRHAATMTRSHTAVPPDPMPYYNNSQTLGADYYSRTRDRRPIVTDCNDHIGTPVEAQAASRYGTMTTYCDYSGNSASAEVVDGFGTSKFNQSNKAPKTAVEELESTENNVDELTESMQCTASVSMESLNSIEHNDEWPSTITTASNSGTQSPTSGSELPDSPSHCSATLFAFDNLRMIGGSPRDGGTSSSRTLSGPEKKSPLFGTGKTHRSNGLLTDAVDNGVDERLLNDMVNSVLPKKPNNQYHARLFVPVDDGLLNECIASVMPRRPTDPVHMHATPANNSVDGTIDWDDSTHFPRHGFENLFWNGHVSRPTIAAAVNTNVVSMQDDDEASQNKELFKALKKSSLLENYRTSEKVRNAEQLRWPEPSGLADSIMVGSSSSESDNYNFVEDSRVSADFPVDIDEQFQRQASLTVDCEEYGKKISGEKSSTASYMSSPTKLKIPSIFARKPVTPTQGSPQLPAKLSAAISPRISQTTSVNRKTRPPVASKPKWTMSNKQATNAGNSPNIR